jgi:hypothetical protein
MGKRNSQRLGFALGLDAQIHAQGIDLDHLRSRHIGDAAVGGGIERDRIGMVFVHVFANAIADFGWKRVRHVFLGASVQIKEGNFEQTIGNKRNQRQAN